MTAFDDWVTSVTPTTYWKFNEGSSNFADSSGNSLTGTANGGITYSQTSLLPNDSDTSILLNGTTGRVSVADNALLRFSDSMTLFGWFQPTVGKVTHLFAKGFAYGADLPGQGVIRMTTTANTPSLNWTVVTGNTLFFAHTHDKASGLQCLYVNGKRLVTHQLAANTGVGAGANTSVLELGSFAGAETLPAYVQKWGTVARALTASEVQAGFLAGVKTQDETSGRAGAVMPYARYLLTLADGESAVVTNSSDTPMWMSRGADAVVGSGQGIQPRGKATVTGSEFAGQYSFIHNGYLGQKLLSIDKF
jgi:hypothetical protein